MLLRISAASASLLLSGVALSAAFTLPTASTRRSGMRQHHLVGSDSARPLSMSSDKDPAPFFASEVAEKEAESVESEPTGTVTATLERERKPEFMEEANDALTAVGWSSPLDDAELTSDDPFVMRINEQIRADVGVDLEELLNPAKVVNLERDLFNLRSELAYVTGKGSVDVTGMTTEECDGGGGGEEANEIRKSIDKKEKSLLIERRAVFRGWLKNVFLGQAVLSLALSWVMVSNPASLFGGFDWYQTNNLDISIRVLGFWWWWLFIIPSLRSRRPKGGEKKALDIAFLGTPLISLVAPALTKDTEAIWAANLAVTVAAYAYGFLIYNEDEGDDIDGEGSGGGPAWLKFIYKSLDFGAGRERGARK